MVNGERWRLGVAGAVVREGRLLLVRHTYGEKKEFWTMPGGYAHHDERLDQSAVRELREETGLETEVTDIIGLVTRCADAGGEVFVVFRMHPTHGQPVPDGIELDRVAWFSAEELAMMTDRELLPTIRHPAFAALRGRCGLLEDEGFPARSETARAFLIGSE